MSSGVRFNNVQLGIVTIASEAQCDSRQAVAAQALSAVTACICWPRPHQAIEYTRVNGRAHSLICWQPPRTTHSPPSPHVAIGAPRNPYLHAEVQLLPIGVSAPHLNQPLPPGMAGVSRQPTHIVQVTRHALKFLKDNGAPHGVSQRSPITAQSCSKQ